MPCRHITGIPKNWVYVVQWISRLKREEVIELVRKIKHNKRGMNKLNKEIQKNLDKELRKQQRKRKGS